MHKRSAATRDDPLRRFDAVIQTMHDGFVAFDSQGLITAWNPSAETILGWSAKEAVGRHVLDLLKGETETAAEFAANMSTVAAGGDAPAATPIEREVPRRDGTRIRLRIAGRTLPTDGGFEVALFFQDITAKHAAEEDLRRQGHYLRDIEALAGIGVWSWDPVTDEASRSDELLKLHGLEGRSALTHGDFLESVLEEDRPSLTSAIAQVIETRQPQMVEYRIVRPTGDIRWVNGRIDVEIQNGRAVRLYGAAADITDTKDHQRRQEMLDFVVSSSAEAILTHTLDGTVQSWSPGAHELFGYSGEDVIGRNIMRLACESGRRALTANIDSVLGGAEVDRRDVVGCRSDGTIMDLHVSTFAVRDAGSVVGLASIIRDVTSERQAHAMLEAALARESEAADNLRELERLRQSFLTAVSHELRTPLTSIIGFADVLSSQSIGRLNAKQRDAISAIDRGGQRLERLIESLLTYSSIAAHTLTLKVAPVDVVDLLGSVDASASPLALTRSVNLEVAYDANIGRVTIDVEHVTRALLNVVRNAIKFTPPDGEVMVASSIAPEAVVIEVRDTGIGIEPKELQHLINPFSRSSAADEQAFQGIGLGLTVAARVLRLHGGDLTIDSEVGSGTTVKLVIPRYPRPESTRSQSAA